MNASAAILAGGRAVRFGGTDKGALLVDGRSIRDRQIAELAAVTADVFVVTAPDSVVDASVRMVADRVPGCGPLGGLHTALLEARGEVTILLACDMPYVSAALMKYLIELARDADAVVPRTSHGYHPLCAAYRRACLEPVARRLADKRLKMIDLLADLRVRDVGAEELRVFGDVDRLLANVNSPDEYREIQALQRHQP